MRLRTGVLLAVVALAALFAWLVRGAGRDGEAVRGGEAVGAEPARAPAELAGGAQPEAQRESVGGTQAPAPAAAAASAVTDEPGPDSGPDPVDRRIRVRVVDERTGEPVPDLAVLVGPGRASESLRTDAEGRLRTAGAFDPGEVSLRVMERDTSAGLMNQPVVFEHDPHAEPMRDVPVRIGPTYRIALERPDSPEPVHVAKFVARLDSESPRVRPYDSPAHEAPLRDGTTPWVRFSRPMLSEDPPPPWRLTVRSPDGAWSGDAPVDSIVGFHVEPVSIRLEPRAWIEGRLTRPRGGSDGSVFLELQGPADDGGLGPVHEPVPEDGYAYRIGWLAPGAYRIRAFARDCDHPWVSVAVRAGAGTQLDLTLLQRPLGGALAGVIEAADRGSIGGLLVVLVPDGETRLVRTTDARWDAERGLATWRFDDVPVGTYELRVFGAMTRPIRPASLTASPPAESLAFRVLSALDGARTYHLRPIDAESGACIAGPELWYRAPGDDNGTRTSTTGCRLSIGGFLPGEPFEWVLRCGGYESAWGTQADLPDEGAGGVEVDVDVPVRRGWNARFRVVDPSGAPVVGAELSADGPAPIAPVATDATGCAVLAAPARPERVRIGFGDWRIASGDLQPDGTFAAGGFAVEVVLAPPE